MNVNRKLYELYELTRIYLNETDAAPQQQALKNMAHVVGELEKVLMHQLPADILIQQDSVVVADNGLGKMKGRVEGRA